MTDPKPHTWNTLRRGSRGPDVVAWQNILIGAKKSLAPYGADGDFGGLTERKTKDWQKDHGLGQDGVVGPETRAAIESHCHTEPAPPPDVPTGGLIELFRSAGLQVVDSSVPPRPNRKFDPVGVIIHHTATGGSSDTPSLSIIRTGRPYLSGPIVPVLIGRLGTIHVTCDEGGLSNHAGKGRSVVLDKVRRGEPLDPTDVSYSVSDDVFGNEHFYGIELENVGNGIEPFGAEQYESTLGVTRALMARHEWDKFHVIAHHEWSRRKIDPHRDTFSIDAFREAL